MSGLSIDFFGTLNNDYGLWTDFLKEIRRDDVKIHVISGPWQTELIDLLDKAGYHKGEHYDYAHSILSYLASIGADTFYDEGYDSWYSTQESWWSAKAEICKLHRIQVHLDSDIRFKDSFIDIPTRFVHIDKSVRDYIDTITNIMEAEAEDLDYEESLKMV